MSSVQIPMTPGQAARTNSEEAEHRSGGFGRWRAKPPNPFEKLDASALVALYPLEPSWPARLNRYPALQLVGDSGRGKTTTLLQMRAFLGAAVYHYSQGDLPRDEAEWTLLDEAQRVDPTVLRAWLAGRRVVLGTHWDLDLSLPSWSLDDPDPVRIARLLNRRLEAWGAVERVGEEAGRVVAHAARGSLERARAVAFLAWAETGTVTPEALARAGRELGA